VVVVKIELWPHGDSSKAKQIGQVNIALETVTQTEEIGDYSVELLHAGMYWGRPGNWKTGRLTGHRRMLSPYHLVMRAIAACIGR
jgi:hypothetical protein